MNKRERVFAALNGDEVDRSPVALWRHFPEHDQTAGGLAQAVAAWQKKWDWDFVKVTPTSGYYYEDWGATFEYRPQGNAHGTRTVLSRPVQSRQDLENLAPLDITQGVYGRELQALRELRKLLDEDVPVLETIFSPFNVANSLMGEFLATAVADYPDELRQAMDTITEVTTEFAVASLEAGADSIFFATQMAQPALASQEQFQTWGIPYDQQVLNALRDETDFVLLHVHGDDVYFDLPVPAYPVDAVNWHTRITGPSLQEALTKFDGAVVGGLTEEVLVAGHPDEVRAQAVDAVEQTGGERVIVGAGCVTPITTPEDNIQAVRQAIV
ncbi:MAG: Uroporphyrinogen decarboxylase [Anaerolineales bacterium]|nr:Uroporphyrinogen decarboxylase [Anaerolineales bacterium]